MRDYQVIRGETHDLLDVSEFIETLSTLENHPASELKSLFDPEREVVIARAPGRLDVMGGIADYSGSLVLELPIAEATIVALQKDDSRRLSIVSLLENEIRSFQMALSEFERDGLPIGYEEAREYFKSDRTLHWAAYIAGVFLVLRREVGTRFDCGARLLISSRVPEGKGVSSSAALEVAVMSAVAAAFEVEVAPRELALLCQRVENMVVGAPCGVMDQMTAVCGRANELLAMVCQPAEVLESIVLAEDLAVWGIDSGTRHSIGEGDYASVRAGTFMGYRIIADLAGLNVEQAGERLIVDDPRWGGYLANVDPIEFEERFAARLPERILGDEFLARYGGTTNTTTTVKPGRTYAVRAPTAHAVYESSRVRRFGELLRCGSPGKGEKFALGELMYESHASYSACGLGSKETDLLVELVRAAGVEHDLFGAKITGGGSGGTVAVLGSGASAAAIGEIASRFAELTGYKPYIFSGSSPGSAAFGHLVVRRIDAAG